VRVFTEMSVRACVYRDVVCACVVLCNKKNIDAFMFSNINGNTST
jgi:hypothetical protein